MKIKLIITARDGQDGSFSIDLHNTKKEGLDSLDRTEKELKEGCFYEDGELQEIELDIDEKTGKLKESVTVSFGD